MAKKNQKSKIPIDLSAVLERIGGDKSFLKELLQIYVEDFKEKSQQLQKAIEERNFVNIQNTGHSLKGASANLSLGPLQETAYNLELAGKEKDLKKAEKEVEQLNHEFEVLKNFLSKEEI